jgi:galactokinase
VAGDVSGFEHVFGGPPQARARAHGRVNLIGEHTDYNGGFVLPTPVALGTTAMAARAPGRHVRVYSAALGEACFELGDEQRSATWIDYVAGVTQELARRGHRLGGFDLYLSTELPLGGGLSSSAALEIAVVRVLTQLFGLTADARDAAAVGHAAENALVGARTGVMDQLAVSLGRHGEALLIDCRTLATQSIALPPAIEIAVIDSGVRHRLADGAYNRRREECERAATALGVRQLRDVPNGDDRLARLPEPLRRRAAHVVSENARVLDAVDAVRAGDAAALGALIDASHESLARDFEVSTPQLDRLARLARSEGAVGARLTGGGFGGSLLALTPAGCARAVAERTVARFNAEGGAGAILLPAAAAMTPTTS